MKVRLNNKEAFVKRHLGEEKTEQEEMLNKLNINSIDELIQQTIPQKIQLNNKLNIPKPLSEKDFINHFKEIANENQIKKSLIGQGYYNCITPSVIQRNILENPGWYTAYTPYQAEIAQGRLEMLINFQTLVSDLTGLPIANASLLDEATAAAEAMTLLYNYSSRKNKNVKTYLVAETTHPQVIDVLQTRATPLEIQIQLFDPNQETTFTEEIFGMHLQYPNTFGSIEDYRELIDKAHTHNVLVTIGTDLLFLTLYASPGEIGADIAIGSSQRLGVPLGYGGPHAAFFACKEEYKRLIPGRIIGITKDSHGNEAYRMALQTREQHIKREKATSNICTAQVLLAVMSAAYAIYHGSKGLRNIASQIKGLTTLLKGLLEDNSEIKVKNKEFFDTLFIELEEETVLKIKEESERLGYNFRYLKNNSICISLDETCTTEDIETILKILSTSTKVNTTFQENLEIEFDIQDNLVRKTKFLTHEVFNKYHTEHEFLRYIKRLENKDLSLTHGMIPLGSCTMKLNATTQMLPLSWSQWMDIHPFVPIKQAKGYQRMISTLEEWLCEITGFSAISFQPNSGAQGEYAGLMAIRSFHEHNKDYNRKIILIPSSAHGTNPASAVMAGMTVVIVKCDEKGNVDLEDLNNKINQYQEKIAGLMITYPSTHGVFEEDISNVCTAIHEVGGKVYMDGANMNAQVGLTSPAKIGADVCHLNLHKTFCIPHGGGGPGMGPIGVTQELAQFLPKHFYTKMDKDLNVGSVAAAPWSSASILSISYAYIAMMGSDELTNATKQAILNANYLMEILSEHYSILYQGKNGRCAHEFIIDCREFKKYGVEVEDIAKRLMDYGFHAPTVSFPVAGTLMIEPTESETKSEIDLFAEALITIRKEIEEIKSGIYPKDNNTLKNAPHTIKTVSTDTWELPYSREKAAFPLECLKTKKFWPSVGRVDSAYGDRNLICSCTPIEEYELES